MQRKLSKIAAFSALAFAMSLNTAYADGHEDCDVDAAGMPASGTITATVTSIGFMLSARWGDGVLTLNDGTERKFHLVGAKALETGVASNDFVGEVYNLKNVEDFEGTYYGAGTKVNLGTATKGEGAANNAKCVVLKYRMEGGGGLQVSGPAPGGVEVSFID